MNQDVTGIERCRLRWSVAEQPAGLRVTLAGVIDEHAHLDRLRGELGPRIGDRAVTMDLSGVERITSAGVREWILFMRGLPQGKQYVWDPGAPVMIKQASAIVGFLGGATVESFLYPHYCPACDLETTQRFSIGRELDRDRRQLPRLACSRCQAALEPAEEPSQYLSFLDG